MMLAICFVPLSLRSSSPGISQVGLSPGSLILSVRGLLAMSVRRASVWSCWAGDRIHWGGVALVAVLQWGTPVGGAMLLPEGVEGLGVGVVGG